MKKSRSLLFEARGSVRRFDEDQASGSNGLLRWTNDRGYLFEIPVDMERTQPDGKVVFARDDANITDWIQNALNGYTLRLSKSGRLYVEGRDGLPPELAEIFGRYPRMGANDGIAGQIAAETGFRGGETPEALVEALRSDRRAYDDWKRGRDAEAEHWAEEEARADAEAEQRWSDSGMNAVDYIRSRIDEGAPGFDLDWEHQRMIEHDRAEGRFSAKAKFSVAPEAKKISEETRKEFADDPVTSKWKIRVEPEAFRQLAPRPLESVRPITEKTDNKTVKQAVEQLFVEFGKVHNADDGTDVVFNKNDAGKMMMQSGVDMRTFAPQLKHLFETSTLAFEAPPEKFEGHKFRQNVDWYKYYVNKFVGTDGREKYIRFTVRIENKWTKQGIHAATVSDVAVYENENAEGRTFRAYKLRGAFRAFTDYILSHYIAKGKGGKQSNDNQAKFSVGGLFTGSAADVDGEAKFNAGPSQPRLNRRNFIAGRAMVAEDYGRGEQTPGALAASRELDRRHSSPIAGRGDLRRISLPISELEQLRRSVTGDVVPAHLARRIPGGAAAMHDKAGRLFMNADVWGVVDKTDMQPIVDNLKLHGFFRNEDPAWMAAHSPVEIAHEKEWNGGLSPLVAILLFFR